MVKKVIMPKLGETMEEGEIIKWLKKEGDAVKEGEPLLEIATDKANIEVEATSSGYLKKILVKEGDIVPITKTIAYIVDSMDEEIPLEEGESKKEVEVSDEKEEEKKETPTQLRGVKASPLAKKLAREKGVDLTKIKGTGPGGRIVKEDVIKAIEKMAVPQVEKIEGEQKEIVPSRVEKIMAEKMQLSKREIPHFYLTVEVDFSEAVKLREDLIDEFGDEIRISYTDFLIKACAKALHKLPRINSHYLQGKIISFSRVNIGLAVAREEGLVVPVIKDAHRKGLFEIAKERVELVKKAMEDKLSLDDIEGGTFTLSNLGMMQIKNFAAIINPPQVCLLATGEIKDRPVAIEGEVFVVPVMEMTLSCDHRVVDGYLGSKFLQEVKKNLEKPALLLV